MGEAVVQPWLLRLSLWVVLATFVVLLATIVTARVGRYWRRRTRERELAPLRRDVVAVASGEDTEEAGARLRGLGGRAVTLVEPVLIRYLSKVRGGPAQQITDILKAHGLVRRASRGLTSWSGARRARSAWVLGVMRVDGSGPSIAPLLQDRDRGVAVTAARSLGMLRDEGSAPALLAALAPGRRGRGELPVWVVVEALGALGSGSADVVGQALASADASTRTAAAMTIGRAQHLSQKARLRELLSREDDPTVLAAAARALGAVGGPGDVSALADLTDVEHPRSVRLAAVSALGEIGDRAALAALTELLPDEDARVGELVAEALTALGEPGVAVLRAAAGRSSAGAGAAEYGLVMHSLRRPMTKGA